MQPRAKAHICGQNCNWNVDNSLCFDPLILYKKKDNGGAKQKKKRKKKWNKDILEKQQKSLNEITRNSSQVTHSTILLWKVFFCFFFNHVSQYTVASSLLSLDEQEGRNTS